MGDPAAIKVTAPKGLDVDHSDDLHIMPSMHALTVTETPISDPLDVWAVGSCDNRWCGGCGVFINFQYLPWMRINGDKRRYVKGYCHKCLLRGKSPDLCGAAGCSRLPRCNTMERNGKDICPSHPDVKDRFYCGRHARDAEPRCTATRHGRLCNREIVNRTPRPRYRRLFAARTFTRRQSIHISTQKEPVPVWDVYISRPEKQSVVYPFIGPRVCDYCPYSQCQVCQTEWRRHHYEREPRCTTCGTLMCQRNKTSPHPPKQSRRDSLHPDCHSGCSSCSICETATGCLQRLELCDALVSTVVSLLPYMITAPGGTPITPTWIQAMHNVPRESLTLTRLH